MSLRLSKKHGVNPSVELCFFCQKDKGLILFGQLPQDREAPRATTFNQEPCDKCRDLMTQGVILISVDESLSSDLSNPYRTGGWVVVKDSVIERVVTPAELCQDILKRRAAFISDDAWMQIGLPYGDHQPDSPNYGPLGGSKRIK